MSFRLIRKEKAATQGEKRQQDETPKFLFKTMSAPILIDEARKTDGGLDSDLRFVEKLSGKPFRQGMKIVVGDLQSQAIPILGMDNSDKDQTIYISKIPEGTSLVHSLIYAGADLARVHELIHMQCNVFGNGNTKRTFLRLTYSEGLAYFGECQRLGSKILFNVHICLASMGLVVEGVGALLLANGAYSLVHDLLLPAHGLKHKLGIAALFAINVIYLGTISGLAYVGKLLLKSQLKNVLFTMSLLKLTKEVGDGSTAFQIALEKEPKTWKELLFPLKFYKKEIAAAKAKQAEAEPA